MYSAIKKIPSSSVHTTTHHNYFSQKAEHEASLRLHIKTVRHHSLLGEHFSHCLLQHKTAEAIPVNYSILRPSPLITHHQSFNADGVALDCMFSAIKDMLKRRLTFTSSNGRTGYTNAASRNLWCSEELIASFAASNLQSCTVHTAQLPSMQQLLMQNEYPVSH